MALAADAKSSSSGTNADTLTWSHVCTGTDLILLVGVTTGNSPIAAATDITYNGVSLTKIDAQELAPCRSELWYLIAPTTGTHDIVVTLADMVSAVTGGARSFTGADQSTPLGTAAKAAGTTTPVTVTVTSAAGEYVMDSAGAYKTTAITMTVGAGQTEDWNLAPLEGCVGAGSYEDGAASVTMSWTLSATASGWATVAVPIKPGTGGGGAGETTAAEVWPIPARTEPFAIADGYTGELARALSSIYPHLLAWKVDQGRFVWHDLGWLPAQAQIDAMALADVPLGSGVDPGLILFSVESHDSVVLTSLASSALGASQRRFPDPGGVAGTHSGVLYGSRVEFANPQRLLMIRVWGEDFQQADTLRFAYRWDRRAWYSVGEIHGLPATVQIQDDEGGMFLEWVIGFSDKYAWEPSLPVITRVDAQVEALPEAEARPEADVQIPEAE